MVPLNGQPGLAGANPQTYGQAVGRNPNALLDECREIDHGIDVIEEHIQRLRQAQQASLTDPDVSPSSPTLRERDRLNEDTMVLYRNFVGRVKTLKSNPESGSPKNAPQVGRVDRRLKGAINLFQNVDRDFRKQLRDQMAREIRIVNPELTEEQIKQAVEDTTGSSQIFAQAVRFSSFPHIRSPVFI